MCIYSKPLKSGFFYAPVKPLENKDQWLFNGGFTNI